MSDISISAWQIIIPDVSEIKKLSTPLPIHGDSSAYQYAKIPSENDPRWSTWGNSAGMGENKSLPPYSFNEKSRLTDSFVGKPNERTQLDFRYMQTFVTIPDDFQIIKFQVSFQSVDDGARAYIFNSAYPNEKYPDGGYIAEADLQLGGKQTTSDLSSLIRPGRNRVVIVQFDDTATGNTFKGLQLMVNGKPAPVVKPEPKPLKTVEAGASSTHPNHKTEWLLDTSDRPSGTPYSFWNSVDRQGQGGQVINEWIWVKAEKPAYITKIRIRWARARATDYTISVSSDGKTWTPTGLSRANATTTEDGEYASVDEIACKEIRGQWVRLDMTRAAGNYEYYSCFYIALSGIA